MTRVVVEGPLGGGVGEALFDRRHLLDALAQQLAVVQLQADQREDRQHEHRQYDDVTMTSRGPV